MKTKTITFFLLHISFLISSPPLPSLPPSPHFPCHLHGGSSNLILSPSGRRNEGGPGWRCPAAMARWSRRLAGRLGRDEWKRVGKPAERVSQPS